MCDPCKREAEAMVTAMLETMEACKAVFADDTTEDKVDDQHHSEIVEGIRAAFEMRLLQQKHADAEALVP